MSAELEQRDAALEARVTNVQAQLTGLRTKSFRLIQEGKERLFRAELVDELPAAALAGKLLVSPQDPAGLYVGTGGGLRRIPTQPV